MHAYMLMLSPNINLRRHRTHEQRLKRSMNQLWALQSWPNLTVPQSATSQPLQLRKASGTT
jgi:hypothetical protein